MTTRASISTQKERRPARLQQRWAQQKMVKNWQHGGKTRDRQDPSPTKQPLHNSRQKELRDRNVPNEHTKKTEIETHFCNTTTRETMMLPPSHPLHQTAPCAINSQGTKHSSGAGARGFFAREGERPTARVCTTTTTATPGTTYFENKIGRKQDSNHGTHTHAHAHTADINQDKTQAGRETNSRYIDKSILEKHGTRTKADIFCSKADM